MQALIGLQFFVATIFVVPPGGRSIATEAFKMRKKSLRGD